MKPSTWSEILILATNSFGLSLGTFEIDVRSRIPMCISGTKVRDIEKGPVLSVQERAKYPEISYSFELSQRADLEGQFAAPLIIACASVSR